MLQISILFFVYSRNQKWQCLSACSHKLTLGTSVTFRVDHAFVAVWGRVLFLMHFSISKVQGLVWFTMSLIVILIYTKTWEPTVGKLTYGHLLSNAIVHRFLTGNNYLQVLCKWESKLKYFIIIIGGHPALVYVGPMQIFIYGIIYLVSSLFWTVLSSLQFWGKQLKLCLDLSRKKIICSCISRKACTSKESFCWLGRLGYNIVYLWSHLD